MIKEIQLDVALGKPEIEAQLGDKPEISAKMCQRVYYNRDYENLTNKPSINDVELVGNKDLNDLYIVSEGTTAYWNSQLSYIPKEGQIIVYTDFDENGPAIKIGDGLAYVVDLPFLTGAASSEIMAILQDHISNTDIHITSSERTSWNSKVTCYYEDGVLVFVSDYVLPDSASGNNF